MLSLLLMLICLFSFPFSFQKKGGKIVTLIRGTRPNVFIRIKLQSKKEAGIADRLGNVYNSVGKNKKRACV